MSNAGGITNRAYKCQVGFILFFLFRANSIKKKGGVLAAATRRIPKGRRQLACRRLLPRLPPRRLRLRAAAAAAVAAAAASEEKVVVIVLVVTRLPTCLFSLSPPTTTHHRPNFDSVLVEECRSLRPRSRSLPELTPVRVAKPTFIEFLPKILLNIPPRPHPQRPSDTIGGSAITIMIEEGSRESGNHRFMPPFYCV